MYYSFMLLYYIYNYYILPTYIPSVTLVLLFIRWINAILK